MHDVHMVRDFGEYKEKPDLFHALKVLPDKHSQQHRGMYYSKMREGVIHELQENYIITVLVRLGQQKARSGTRTRWWWWQILRKTS